MAEIRPKAETESVSVVHYYRMNLKPYLIQTSEKIELNIEFKIRKYGSP